MKEGFAVPAMQPPVGPAPASAPPAPPVEPPKPITPEQLQAGVKDLYRSIWQEDPPADPSKPKEGEAPPTPAPAAAEAEHAPEAAEPAAPSPAPAVPAMPEPQKPPRAPRLSTAEVIDRTAREVGARVAEAVRSREEPVAPAAEPELDLAPQDAEDLRVIQFLERTQPEKYAGKGREFVDYTQRHYEYQEKWLADHPGEKFDQNSQEHEQWYQDNQPDLQAAVLDEAKIDMRVEQRVEEAYNRRVAPRVAEMEREEAFRKAEPKIVNNIRARQVAIVEEAAPELAKLLKDGSGNALLNPETIGKVEDSDPVAAKFLGNLVGAAEPLFLELEKVAEAGERLKPETNPVHAEIDRYRRQAEADLMASPPADREMDGRDFLPIHDFSRRKEAIERSRGTRQDKDSQIRQLHGRYWTIGVDHLEELIVHDIGQRAKALIADHDAAAAKKYKKSQSNGAPDSPPPPPPPPPPPLPTTARSRPPSISGQPDLVTTDKTGASSSKTFAEAATEVLFK